MTNLFSIETLIDSQYITVSVMEDIRQVLEWLQLDDYFAVMNEKLNIESIVNLRDVVYQSGLQLIDLDLYKPSVTPSDGIYAVLQVMLESGLTHLPVFDGGQFTGVITLRALSLEILKQHEH